MSSTTTSADRPASSRTCGILYTDGPHPLRPRATTSAAIDRSPRIDARTRTAIAIARAGSSTSGSTPSGSPGLADAGADDGHGAGHQQDASAPRTHRNGTAHRHVVRSTPRPPARTARRVLDRRRQRSAPSRRRAASATTAHGRRRNRRLRVRAISAAGGAPTPGPRIRIGVTRTRCTPADSGRTSISATPGITRGMRTTTSIRYSPALPSRKTSGLPTCATGPAARAPATSHRRDASEAVAGIVFAGIAATHHR